MSHALPEHPIHLRRRQLLLAAGASLLPALAPGLAQAQATAAAWPTKPVRILTPFTAGGATDVIARSLAAILTATHKQPFNIEPKPGADGALAAQELLRAPADGHTVYLATASALTLCAQCAQERRLRRAEGLQPADAVHDLQLLPDGAPEPARQDPGRGAGLCQGQPGQVQLRVRQFHRAAGGGAAGHHGRRGPGACALQGRVAGGGRHGGRAGADDVVLRHR